MGTTTVAATGNAGAALDGFERRVADILRARPVYQEWVDFYRPVFRLQLEEGERLSVHPTQLGAEERRRCLSEGDVLAGRFDPGLDADSLIGLWGRMAAIFRSSNEVLRQAVDAIDRATRDGRFEPGAWLLAQRPRRRELVAEACRQTGASEAVLSELARAVTFPHWEQVARTWLPQPPVPEWQRSLCPVCGGPAGLAEVRCESGAGDSRSALARRLLHCAFCGARWDVPPLGCPACGSDRVSDAKYWFTAREPELRIEFCGACRHYVKAILADRVPGRIHVGLELLTTTHLDAIAQERGLVPLEVGE